MNSGLPPFIPAKAGTPTSASRFEMVAMRILIVTPAERGSQKGNRISAERWAKMLRQLGHSVKISTTLSTGSHDLLIALHAVHSAAAVREFRARFPERPIILMLTGTDLNRESGPSREMVHSLRLADRVVLLEPEGARKLNKKVRDKSIVIYQSATPIQHRPSPLKRHFEVTVLGHLRKVKDPFRTAKAARLLPEDSRIRVAHFGSALSGSMQREAEKETATNPRYRWHGLVTHGVAMRRLARSRLTVLSSYHEGGPSVISEAIVNNVPILSSRMGASIGMLGADFPGFFECGDEVTLAKLMYRAEVDSRFYKRLLRAGKKRKGLFTPRKEQDCLRNLLKELVYRL